MCDELNDYEVPEMPASYPHRPPYLYGPPHHGGVHINVSTAPNGETRVLVEAGPHEAASGPGWGHAYGGNGNYTYQGSPGLHCGAPGFVAPMCSTPVGEHPPCQVELCMNNGSAVPGAPAPHHAYAGTPMWASPAWGSGAWPETAWPEDDPHHVLVNVRVGL